MHIVAHVSDSGYIIPIILSINFETAQLLLMAGLAKARLYPSALLFVRLDKSATTRAYTFHNWQSNFDFSWSIAKQNSLIQNAFCDY